MTVFGQGRSRVVPVPRVDNRRAWSMARLESRCDVPGVSAGERFDVFYDGLWEDGSSAVWLNREIASRQAESGFQELPKVLTMPREKAVASMFSGRFRAERLRMLAALDSWRTLTCEQAAAFAGAPGLLDVRSTIPRSMWNLDLVDFGQFRGLAGRGFNRRGWLYRPSRGDAFESEVAPRLTWPEWMSVTAGMPFNSFGQFDRHNVLAAELGLRLAEFADIGTVLGEKLSRAELLCSHLPAPLLPRGETKSADLTVVRPDGLRIAVEITANSSATFASKVARWAALLDAAPLAESGLVVLFVVVAPGDLDGSESSAEAVAHRSLRNVVARRIAHAVRDYPGQVGDRVADRMFLASWQEWFPARGRLGADFLTLRALSPSGPAGDLWQEKLLLGDSAMPLRARNRDALLAVLENAQTLAGVPLWARHRDAAPDPAQMLLTLAGRDEIPAPPAPSGLAVGAGVGVAGPTTLPARLQWL